MKEGPSFYVHQMENEDFVTGWNGSKLEEKIFLEGVNGSFLIFPFQCDLCWFRNLELRSPREDSLSDKRIMHYIRRVNLDGIWSRSRSTIGSVRRSISQLINVWKELGVTPELPPLGPWPVADSVGFRLALAQLKYSQNSGVNRKSHLQYDTIRRLRTAFVHVSDTSCNRHNDGYTVGFRAGKGDLFRASSVPTDSKTYSMINRGMLLRMGKQTQTDLGLDIRVLHLILNNLKVEIQNEEGNYMRVRELMLLGTLLIIGFVCALRGNECFMLDAQGLLSHINVGQSGQKKGNEHVVIPLLGRFKNEDGNRLHLMVAVNVTASGLEVRLWLECWAALLTKENRTSGPAFCTPSGELISRKDVECGFHNQLERIQSEHSHLIGPEIIVRERYSIFRSLRRGSTARATDVQVPSTSIDLHNRWRSRELKKGQRSNSSMRDYYTDLALVINARLEYSRRL